MANLQGDIKNWKKGELCGTVATVFCGIVVAFFAAAFTSASVLNLETLRLVTLILSPVLLVIGIALSAFCNIKFGGANERAIKKYILDVCVENAALMHPERKSLSFYISIEGTDIIISVNDYKGKIIFDFSEFKKLSFARKAFILGEIESRLVVTFCRLYERGAGYTDVGFAEREGTRRKTVKKIFIIKDGAPDKKAFKTYLKNK
ncbi:MAG: hypothetical protein K2L12_03705 [Clostridia bacterium]|nr:hypothetical protein [Clostridia bacterium]